MVNRSVVGTSTCTELEAALPCIDTHCEMYSRGTPAPLHVDQGTGVPLRCCITVSGTSLWGLWQYVFYAVTGEDMHALL